MSMELANEAGMIDQVASNGGFADLAAAVRSTSSTAVEHVCLEAFLERGFTDSVENCITALREMAKDKDLAKDVTATALQLAKLMDGESFVILTDGTSDDEEK
jgi:hypothetical protein